MSDLFRSALGYLSNSGPVPPGGSSSSSGGPGSGGGQGGHYSSASGGPSDETNAVGEVIPFTHNGRTRNVKIQKLIAEGGFSYVFRGVDLQSGDPIAVKKILAPDPEAKKAVDYEIEFMRQFQHEHIVQFFGSFMKSSNKNLQEHYLGMEFCPVPLPTPPFRLQHTTQVFAQTCKAIKYLHEFGIIHRDIKLENLLIGSDGLVKLVDFGSATMDKIYPTPDWSMNKRTIVEEQIASKTTPMYRAPEMLDLWSNHPIDEHVDLWALGCLLFALNFGQHPFQDSNKLAIVNANYSFPKNVSDSGPIVTLIRGLLKVNPAERLSFGQMFEVLVSIAESEGFSLKAQLPFKAASSPNVTGGGPGIVNPLGSAGATPSSAPLPQQYPQQSQQIGSSGGSLFSSLKGGAASLLKNIKEQSQQYLAPVVPLSNAAGQSDPSSSRRLSNPSAAAAPPVSRPPPPRPSPPSPLIQRKEDRDRPGNGHIEFENREYEAMQKHHQQQAPPHRPAPPKKPPPPKIISEPQQQTPKIANLLDISFDGIESQGTAPVSQNNSATNSDLLDDLFGSSAPQNNFASSQNKGGGSSEDFLWGGGSGGSGSGGQNNSTSYNNKSAGNVGDLLGDTSDPFASLLGKSVPNSMPSSRPQNNPMDGFPAFGSSQPFLQPSNTSIPSSASFQNLNSSQRGGGGRIGNNGSSMGAGLLDTGASRIPKNSSSPNLLSDLILDDIIGPGMNKVNLGPSATAGSNFNKSNPSLNQSAPLQNPAAGVGADNQRPNYNRHQIFDPPAGTGVQSKQKMDDVFADILNSQGFAAGNKNDQGKTINDLRKIEMLADPNMDPTQMKVNEWREGKKKNIRALLSSLHTVTWDECHWEETNMSQMITPAQVKKTYRKACLAIHPDKQMGKDWEDLAKYIFVELNEAWAAFEESQQQGGT